MSALEKEAASGCEQEVGTERAAQLLLAVASPLSVPSLRPLYQLPPSPGCV